MPDVPKEDSLERRLLALEDRAGLLETTARRRVNAISSTAFDSTTSTSFVDLGPTLAGVQPGQTGKLLIGVTAGHYLVQPGELSIVSFRLVSATQPPVASSDFRASAVENSSGNGGGISVYSTFWTVLNVGPYGIPKALYDIIMTVRSGNGGVVEIDGRGLIAIAI